MTDSELQDAIVITHAMVRKTGVAEASYKATFSHYEALLKEQGRRATVCNIVGAVEAEREQCAQTCN